ncbi:MAG: hypothetical protein RJA36_28 [Pseudomonadota bacterium]|jgi:hypothetical protein
MRLSKSLPVVTRVLLLLAALGFAVAAPAQDAAALRSRHEALQARLADNAFRRPLVLESAQDGGRLRGEIHAVLAHPFDAVAHALQDTAHWCDILILHLNVKYCRPRGAGADSRLDVVLGRKFDQPLEEAYPLAFAWRLAADSADYQAVQLLAEAGPLGTRDYRIEIEATPLDAQTTFLHLSYAYRYGLTARLALQGYLATLARDKVGFTVVGRDDEGAPVYIGGVRGVVERNAMRYFLAIESYLDAAALPAAQQAERRLGAWIDAVERYPRQLHELTREDYLAMKHKELERQQSVLLRAN